MQKTNTLLLVIIAGLLAALLLKPAPGRYEVYRYGSLGPADYLLDTATGREVLIQVSDEVKADQRAKEAAKQPEKNAAEARDKAYEEERLSKSCPEVLAKPLSKIADAVDRSLMERDKKECQDWLRSKGAQSPSKSAP
jgi:hypothetical protein